MKQKILIFGGEGMVGSRFVELNQDQFEVIAPLASETDLLNIEQSTRTIKGSAAPVVVNFAAFTDVGKAEEDKGNRDGLAYRLNVESVKDLSAACKKDDKYFIQISTEYVFDGKKAEGLYTEEDTPSPINWYGQTKFLGEQAALESGCECLIARISMPYRARFDPKKDIARRFLEMLQKGQEIHGCTDAVNTVTLIDDIAYGLGALLKKRPTGIIHLAAVDSISPYNFACLIAEKFNLDQKLVKPVTLEEYSKNSPVSLLKNSGLSSAKFGKEYGEGILHSVEEGLEIFKKQLIPIQSGLTG